MRISSLATLILAFSAAASTVEPQPAGQSQTGRGQSQSGQSQSGQSQAGQSQAGQSQAGQSQAGQSQASQNQAAQGQAARGQAGQSQAGQGQGRSGAGRGGGAQGQNQRPAVVRPPGQRIPPRYSIQMDRPIAMADNVWMSELTILEMRDLVRVYGYKTALILNGTMEANGPYLTTGKHNHVLRVTGEAIARTLGKTLIAPIVMLDGGNPENTTQPGRLVLAPTTLQLVLRDMATSLKAQGFTEIFLIGDSGSNQTTLRNVASELAAAWAGQGVLIAHIPEYYNYADVLRYQNEVLGKVELDKDLDGYHDDYYITSMIMNDSPRHVRYEERVKVGLDHINSLEVVLDEALAIGKKLAQFRADVTVAAIQKRRDAQRSAGGGGAR